MPSFYGRRKGDRVEISGADARHLARSLRARPGQLISVVEPEGRLLRVRLEAVDPGSVWGRVEESRDHRPEPPRALFLALALLPAAALEQALSRCTEAGAAGFILVRAERSVARPDRGKAGRWATICREAAMLAGRLVVPAVEGPVSFEEAWARASQPYLLDPSGPPIDRLPDKATLFVGPEGGWAPAERERAQGRVVGLGPRNLRAETAALVGLALALGPV